MLIYHLVIKCESETQITSHQDKIQIDIQGLESQEEMANV